MHTKDCCCWLWLLLVVGKPGARKGEERRGKGESFFRALASLAFLRHFFSHTTTTTTEEMLRGRALVVVAVLLLFCGVCLGPTASATAQQIPSFEEVCECVSEYKSE